MHLTKQPDFPTSYEEIVDRIASIDPIRYASSRNYTNGAVSYLSPYISRGVISARQVMSYLIDKGYAFHDIEKFIQELAWRDYWQRVWQSKKDEINYDLKQPQKNVRSHKISKAIVRGQTSIEAIDNAIAHFYETG